VPANCWFAIGPAVVLAAAGSPGPDWGDWPLYLLALVAQFACDVASGAVRDRLDPEVEQAPALRGYAFVWAIDAALSPIGLLAAFASEDGRFAFLAVLPLAALLVSFSHERTRRFEAERSALRAREALIAGASHELQTPLAVVSGIVERLTRGPELPAERRAQAYATLERQTGHLRYLVGRFVHYSRLKAGQPLPRRPRTVALDDALAGVAALWTPEATIELDAAPGLAVHADPGDVHAVLMALVANALKHGPPSGPVRVSARARDGRMTIEVADRGPGLPEDRLESVFAELDLGALDEGAGIGLFLARTAARQHGGDVRLRNGSGGGLVAIVELPSA
jgi:signal transduction histidine kinase